MPSKRFIFDLPLHLIKISFLQVWGKSYSEANPANTVSVETCYLCIFSIIFIDLWHGRLSWWKNNFYSLYHEFFTISYFRCPRLFKILQIAGGTTFCLCIFQLNNYAFKLNYVLNFRQVSINVPLFYGLKGIINRFYKHD